MTHLPRLFIVDGIISLPIALAGYLFIPDVPETSRAFFLSKDVRERCRWDKVITLTKVSFPGPSICQEENAARRSQATSTVHHGKNTEDLDILAYLRTYGTLCVSLVMLSFLYLGKT